MTNRIRISPVRAVRTLPQPAWLPENIWPFQTFGIESNGSVLAVTEAGDGPVLLFVHVGAWSFIWRDLMTRLASNFRCIVDLRGTAGLRMHRQAASSPCKRPQMQWQRLSRQ